MGPQEETEMWQPGIVLLNKINTNNTYLAIMNFWAPLEMVEDNNKQPKEEFNIINTKATKQNKINKWTRRVEARRIKCIEIQMIIDSATTSNFISDEHDLPKTGTSKIKVYLPDNSTLQTSDKTLLPFEQLSKEAREAHILPGLKKSLLSVNKMAENGHTTIFHKGNKGVTIHKSGTLTITTSEPPVLRGSKPTGSNLWTVLTDGNKPQHEEANNVYSLPSMKESIRYLHASADDPDKDTWTKAIKAGNFTTWPGLSVKAVHKYFPESDETNQWHMKKQHQNIRSTKIKIKPDKNEPVPDLGNQEDIPSNTANPNIINNQEKAKPKKMCDMFIQIHNANNTAHSDQTGCFPVTSSSGNKYIMVLVEVDGNFIDAEPMKNKTAGSMIKAYLVLWNRLTASETVKPTTHLLDNKASEEFKAEIRKKCTIQLVPPDNHQQNLAEQAIQTFKNHFKAILAGVDDSFSMRLWDKLLPQTILTLNLLCQSNIPPTVSSWQYVHGPFDYNKMPLALMGCAVQIHKSSEQ